MFSIFQHVFQEAFAQKRAISHYYLCFTLHKTIRYALNIYRFRLWQMNELFSNECRKLWVCWMTFFSLISFNNNLQNFEKKIHSICITSLPSLSDIFKIVLFLSCKWYYGLKSVVNLNKSRRNFSGIFRIKPVWTNLYV